MEKDPTYYHLNVVNEENPKYVCKFCKKYEIDEINFGPMYTYEDVSVHYFCCLFASGLVQNGNTEKEGILGFLPKDIKKEVLRGRQFKCAYCNISGATVGCCNKRCQKVFHFNCGILRQVNYQFTDPYNTFCVNHKTNKYIPFELNKMCLICMDNIEIDDTLVKASCCPNGIYHKTCIQKMALSAGYFFLKCPACNSTKEFINEMRMLGIYVPERDASWEVEPNAFEELYFTYNKCDSDKCFCAEGREFVEQEGNWSYARCEMCGAAGCHKYCGKLLSVESWACESCNAAIVNVNTNKVNSKFYNASSSSSSSSSSSGSDSDTDTETDLEKEKAKEKSPIKKRPKPKEFDISKVRIRRKAFNYFPYSRQDLKTIKDNNEYNKRRCLMDWRKFELRVELTDWIKGSTFTREDNLANEMPSSSKNIPSCSKLANSFETIAINEDDSDSDSSISSSSSHSSCISSKSSSSSCISSKSSSSSSSISSKNSSSIVGDFGDVVSTENNDLLVTSKEIEISNKIEMCIKKVTDFENEQFQEIQEDFEDPILSEDKCSIVSKDNSEKETETKGSDNLILSENDSTFSATEFLSLLNDIEDKTETTEVQMNNNIPFKEEVNVVEQTEKTEKGLTVENKSMFSQENDQIIITPPKKKRKINPDDDDNEIELQLQNQVGMEYVQNCKIPRLSGDSSKSNSSSSSKENNFLLSPLPSPSKSKNLLNNSHLNLNTHLEFTLENNKIEMEIINDENSNNSSISLMYADGNKAQSIPNLDSDNTDNSTISNLC